MPDYVWCKKEDCRIPTFRCLLCKETCYPERHSRDEQGNLLEMLVKSGKYKERYVMRRKENAAVKNEAPFEDIRSTGADRASVEGIEAHAGKPDMEEDFAGQKVFLMEDGQLKPFSAVEYTASTLYQMVESYSVECRLVRPEDPGNLVFDGKKPAKKTQPIIVKRGGESVLLESWEALEASPEQLADAAEVIGATAVKQVFVLKRK